MNEIRLMLREVIKKIKWFHNKVHHGLFIYGITNRLTKIGLEFRPYYFEQEYTEECESPKIKGNALEYTLKYLGSKEVKTISSSGKGYFNLHEKLEKLSEGQICIGLFDKGKIAAYSWIELKEFSLKGKIVKLKKNEAYLSSMYTVKSYRGRGLAPFLRYQIYKSLMEDGRNKVYSISDYFNYPSIRFKRKLNTKHLKLFLYIQLFNYFKWNLKLKNYKN